MDKPQIIGIGASGLIGSRIIELLNDKYEFISLGTSKGVDITHPETLSVIKDYKDADYILHLAAKADVDGCEKDKEQAEAGDAWKINVEGAKNVAGMSRDTGKKIIYISTDFVFDGEKPVGEAYSEEDLPNPINWYAKTKYEGEKAVEESGADYVIARLAYPYRASFEPKKDFMRTIWDRLSQGLPVKAVTDHIMSPTFIDDLAIGIDALIKNEAMGIYHLVGSEPISPYDASKKIAQVFGLNQDLISPTTRSEFFKDRAPRPFNLALKNDKIKQLGIEMKGFEEGLLILKSQLK